jgi:hypothetical protein
VDRSSGDTRGGESVKLADELVPKGRKLLQ